MYGQYSAQYEKATDVLDEMMSSGRTYKHFHKIVSGAFTADACKGLDFESFLIMPVQRLPRYGLLLRDLKKHTDPEHPDQATITQTLETIDSVNSQINQDIFIHKQREALLLVIQQFTREPQEFYAPSRIFMSQGPLRLLSTKEEWVKMECFLFNDMLAYASVNKIGKRYTLQGTLEFLKGHSSVEVANLPSSNIYSFSIRGKTRQLVLSAESEQAKIEWMRLIDEATTPRHKGSDPRSRRTAADDIPS